jgi:hypothetical protein
MKVLNPILNIPKDVLDVPHLALQSICNLVQDMGHIGHLLVAALYGARTQVVRQVPCSVQTHVCPFR